MASGAIAFDVVEESDGDLMGDGVNIAARLEGVAEPGGICLSEDAYRHVRDKVKEEFVDLGDKELTKLRVPRLCRGGSNSLTFTGVPHGCFLRDLPRRQGLERVGFDERRFSDTSRSIGTREPQTG